jgi:hypothetical protein
VTVQRWFRTKYDTESPTDKTIRTLLKLSQVDILYTKWVYFLSVR